MKLILTINIKKFSLEEAILKEEDSSLSFERDISSYINKNTIYSDLVIHVPDYISAVEPGFIISMINIIDNNTHEDFNAKTGVRFDSRYKLLNILMKRTQMKLNY